ncbi:hypothetical protein D1J36_008315 [Riemerella anatipestifer]|uniref:hypothetical protein n=1 Tax=Riemerella anatipestifer TaxID=34085 RepID=UPI00207B2608|nr:hypothetical protein [Riemerella anatipestifer]USL95273.1 hypothetical protein D1J36_008315 [Riemerella anatipestifer]
MKKQIFILVALSINILSYAQIKTNKTVSQNVIPNQTAFLDASSTPQWNTSTNIGKGLVFPRTDLTQLNTLIATPNGVSLAYPNRLDGMIVYNTATGKSAIGNVDVTSGFYYYENKSNTLSGGTWKPLGGTSPITTNIYTADGTLAGNRTVTLGTNNLSFMGDGNVGIGTQSPSQKLEVNGNAKINQMTDATPLENEYTKAVVAKPDGTLGVVSRTNPTIPSGVEMIYGNAPIETNIMPNETFYSIQQNSARGLHLHRYSGQSITLPPGKWAIYCAYLVTAAPAEVLLPTGSSVWVRASIDETMQEGAYKTAVIPGSPTLISCSFNSGDLYQVASGVWLVDNNTNAEKTYYVKISLQPNGLFKDTDAHRLANMSRWMEDYIFALKRN